MLGGASLNGRDPAPIYFVSGSQSTGDHQRQHVGQRLPVATCNMNPVLVYATDDNDMSYALTGDFEILAEKFLLVIAARRRVGSIHAASRRYG